MQPERRAAAPHLAVAATASPRVELAIVLLVAWALVIARSLVYVFDEQGFFNSDQAVSGLMAKHLLEGRAFPLFFYGQQYLLAVQSWIAVPFFAVAGPTVAALIASVVAANLAIVTLLILGLHRMGQLRPLVALVPALFYILAPAVPMPWLLEAGGANGMPFFYVLLLWLLRERPIWLGALAAVGFLNREFSAYAVPMLLLADLKARRLFTFAGARHWLLAGVAALAVLQTVQALKPYADYFGPGTRGQLLRGFDESQIGNLGARTDFVPSAFPARAAAMIGEHVPRLLGARPFDDGFGMRGHPALRWPLLIALFAVSARVLVLVARRRLDVPEYGIYLTGVGVIAAAVYVLTRPAEDPVDRYLVLVLLIPAGLTALHLAIEPRRIVRWAVIASVLWWTALSATDHAALARQFFGQPPARELRDVIDALRARGVQVAETGYWRAYKLTFLAREEVKVASTDFVRIDEYQHLANAAGRRLVSIREEPCPGGQVVGEYYLCQADAP